MYINQLMKEQNMTFEELCDNSGIADSTLRDILDGTSYVPNCKASTLYDIAFALNTTVEDILENCWNDDDEDEYEDEEDDEFVVEPDRPEAFYPAQEDFLMAMYKINNDISFVYSLLKTKAVEEMADMNSSTMTLYAVAMIDYLCRIHKLPVPKELDFYRKYRLSAPVYPISVMKSVNDPVQMKQQIEELENNAIPEFLRFNIYETAEHIRGKK